MAKTKIINLTPHPIVLNGGRVIQPSGTVARVSATYVPDGSIDGIPVSKQAFGNIVDLPMQQPDTFYIVSAVVLAAAKAAGRTDVVAPDTGNAVRNDAGHIVSVPGFVR